MYRASPCTNSLYEEMIKFRGHPTAKYKINCIQYTLRFASSQCKVHILPASDPKH